MPSVEIEVVRYPFGDATKDMSGIELLPSAVAEVAHKLSERIENNRDSNHGYMPNCAVVMLDPTAEAAERSIDTIMFMICVGEKGRSLLIEAAGKACEARNRAIMGFNQLQKPYLRGAGGWCGRLTSYGRHGLFSGMAGHDDSTNRTEGHRVETDFAGAVSALIKQWKERYPEHAWYDNNNLPHHDLQRVHQLNGQRFTITSGGSLLPTSG